MDIDSVKLIEEIFQLVSLGNSTDQFISFAIEVPEENFETFEKEFQAINKSGKSCLSYATIGDSLLLRRLRVNVHSEDYINWAKQFLPKTGEEND